MSQVWIRADEGARGSIPARCAKRGERCINRVRLESSDLAGPLEWATWSGLWPRRRQQEPKPVVVSLLPRVERLHRGLARTRDVTTILVVALTIIALLTGGLLSRVALLAALASLVAKVATAIIGGLWAVDVTTDVTGDWLLLANLHPDFVTAAEAATTRPDAPPILPARQDLVPSSDLSRVVDAPAATLPQAPAPDGS